MTPLAEQPPLPAQVRFLTDADGARLFGRGRWKDPEKTCLTCCKETKAPDGEEYTVYRWYAEGSRDPSRILNYQCSCVDQYRLHRWLARAGIGLSYQRASWDDQLEMPLSVLEAALDYAINCDYHINTGNNLVFWSADPGTGKTFLASLLAKRLLLQGAEVLFTAFGELMDLFTDSWRQKDERDYFNERVRAADVLVIDDLGREHPGRVPVAEAALESVLRYRVREALPTVLTTNLQPEEMLSYGDKLASLLTESVIMVEVGGADKRPMMMARKEAEHQMRLLRPIVMT